MYIYVMKILIRMQEAILYNRQRENYELSFILLSIIAGNYGHLILK